MVKGSVTFLRADPIGIDLSFLIVLRFLIKANTTAGDTIRELQLLRSSSVTEDALRKVERAGYIDNRGCIMERKEDETKREKKKKKKR